MEDSGYAEHLHCLSVGDNGKNKGRVFKNFPAAIDAFDDMIHIFPFLVCAMNLNVGFLGHL